MRKRIVAGNWKMNNNLDETTAFLDELKNQTFPENVSLVIAPAFTNLYAAAQSVKAHAVTIAAQNMHQNDQGAFTGEVSGKMLKNIGITTVILGHSERRAYFGETHELLTEKVNTALANDFQIIFCVGEELKDRKEENHFNVVKKQLKESLFHLTNADWASIVVAYEPVWAIGTGETATPQQAQEMHQFIRSTIENQYDAALSQQVPILYGGSVNPGNAAEIFSMADVDGGLVGGASLKVNDFLKIANSF